MAHLANIKKLLEFDPFPLWQKRLDEIHQKVLKLTEDAMIDGVNPNILNHYLLDKYREIFRLQIRSRNVQKNT